MVFKLLLPKRPLIKRNLTHQYEEIKQMSMQVEVGGMPHSSLTVALGSKARLLQGTVGVSLLECISLKKLANIDH